MNMHVLKAVENEIECCGGYNQGVTTGAAGCFANNRENRQTDSILGAASPLPSMSIHFVNVKPYSFVQYMYVYIILCICTYQMYICIFGYLVHKNRSSKF